MHAARMSSGSKRFFGGLSTPEPAEDEADTFRLTEVAVANPEPVRQGGRLAQLKSQIRSDLEPSVGIHIRRALAQVCPCVPPLLAGAATGNWRVQLRVLRPAHLYVANPRVCL